MERKQLLLRRCTQACSPGAMLQSAGCDSRDNTQVDQRSTAQGILPHGHSNHFKRDLDSSTAMLLVSTSENIHNDRGKCCLVPDVFGVALQMQQQIQAAGKLVWLSASRFHQESELGDNLHHV